MNAIFRKAVVISTALFLSFGFVGERVEANSSLGTTVPIIVIDDEELLLDVPPQILNGRVLVPLRGVFEKLGAVVVWEPETQSIIISDSSKKIKLSTKSQVVSINNEKHNLDTAPFVINGRTMIPLRFVSENLSAKVEWIAASKTVKIIASNKGKTEELLPQVGNSPGNTSSETSNRNNTGSVDDANEQNGENANQDNEENQDNQEYDLQEIEKTIVEMITATQGVKVGQTFNVQVLVRDIADLYTLEVEIAFDPSFLKAKSIKGSFLGNSDIIKSVNNKNGTIDHVATKLGQVPGKNGDGVLTIVTFEALKEGSTRVSFTDDEVQMVSSLGRFINYTKKTESVEISITK